MMGGGTIFKSVTKADMHNIEILLPDAVILQEFGGFISPIHAQLENLVNKNHNLRQTRDLLLPKLISGEIDFSDLDISLNGDI